MQVRTKLEGIRLDKPEINTESLFVINSKHEDDDKDNGKQYKNEGEEIIVGKADHKK